MKNIIVPIDLSLNSDFIIDNALMIAKCISAKLWLIHVALAEPDFIGYDVGPQHERDWRSMKLRDEHLYIQKKALELEKSGCEVTPLLIQGLAAEKIIEQSQRLNAEMIVMGKHSRNFIADIFLGSVATGVLKSAHCPVLLIPAQK